MDNSKLYTVHLSAAHLAKALATAHGVYSFSQCCDESTKRDGAIWINSYVEDAGKELAVLAGYFGFDLVKRDELSKQEAA